MPSKRIDLSYSVKPGPYAFYADVISLVAEGEIQKRPVKFRSADAEKPYDTTPLVRHVVNDVSAEAYDDPCGLVDGETVFFDVTGSRTEVGSSPNDFTVRFIGGDASRITGLKLTCDGKTYEVTPLITDELKAATPGKVFAFGVDPDRFVPSYDSSDHSGYIIWSGPEEKELMMLFGSYQAVRPLEISLNVEGLLRTEEKQAAAVSGATPVQETFRPLSVASSGPAAGLVQGVWCSRPLTTVPGPKITAQGLPKGPLT